MPASRLTKASVSAAIAAAKSAGLLIRSIHFAPDGTLTLDIGESEFQTPPASDQKTAPKKWGENRQ